MDGVELNNSSFFGSADEFVPGNTKREVATLDGLKKDVSILCNTVRELDNQLRVNSKVIEAFEKENKKLRELLELNNIDL